MSERSVLSSDTWHPRTYMLTLYPDGAPHAADVAVA